MQMINTFLGAEILGYTYTACLVLESILFIFRTVILHTLIFPIYCTILYLLCSLLHISVVHVQTSRSFVRTAATQDRNV